MMCNRILCTAADHDMHCFTSSACDQLSTWAVPCVLSEVCELLEGGLYAILEEVITAALVSKLLRLYLPGHWNQLTSKYYVLHW